MLRSLSLCVCLSTHYYALLFSTPFVPCVHVRCFFYGFFSSAVLCCWWFCVPIRFVLPIVPLDALSRLTRRLTSRMWMRFCRFYFVSFLHSPLSLFVFFCLPSLSPSLIAIHISVRRTSLVRLNDLRISLITLQFSSDGGDGGGGGSASTSSTRNLWWFGV